MRPREDYTRILIAALILCVGIFVAFQIYLLREPGRIANVLAADQTEQVTRGQKLFADNCATCHGDQGLGDIGPALNSKKFLKSTDDGVIFSLIGSGVPGTGMPSWSQAHGGPFTDEQIHDLVGFIRSWEPTASDVVKAAATPDAVQGKTIFDATCAICHGANGVGTDKAPALNSQTLLNQFDDKWLDDTIANGRPSQGMPTWGVVLSPEQINSVVAYVRSWQTTASATNPTPATAPANATPTVEVARPSNGNTTPGAAITQNLAANATTGAQVYVDNCQKCHGEQGKGGVDNPGSTDGTVPPLNPIDDTLVSSDPKVFAGNIDLFVEHGSTPDGNNPKLVMPAWGDTAKLTPQQIADVIAYVMGLNSGTAANPTTPPTEVTIVTPTFAAANLTPTAEPAQPSNGNTTPGVAITQNLIGNATTGAQVFVDNCQKCHGEQGKRGVDNPGSTDGTVPPLNPIDDTIVSSDSKVFATNIDLFVEHGSTPEGNNPKLLMPAWGDTAKLTPQQIADVIAYVMGLNAIGATNPTETPTEVATVATTESATTAPTPVAANLTPTAEPARPSNANLTGGAALNLAGNVTNGEQVFVANCQKCHGAQGATGIANPGSTDGTVPPLNPIDDTIVNSDPALFAYNVDLFVEHGSTPEGPNPAQVMPAWGDSHKLAPQQIADVIAYVLSLNGTAPSPKAAPTEVATTAPTPVAANLTPTAEPAQPSNGNTTPGAAITQNLTGNATTGVQVYVANCQKCHGEQGKGGVDNPGSTDGTVPPLNPIDDTMVSADLKVFASNVDLFIEHGSTPEGDNPKLVMPAWGDTQKLSTQQIADVIAYILGLNK